MAYLQGSSQDMRLCGLFLQVASQILHCVAHSEDYSPYDLTISVLAQILEILAMFDPSAPKSANQV